MKVDVAIVGAGPAGSWLARELAREDVSVVLFDRSIKPGEPNFSSAGSPISTADLFDLPRDAIAATWDRLLISSATVEKQWEFPEPVGHVYDFRKLKQLLIEEARSVGAHVRLGVTVKGIERTDFGSRIYSSSQKEECIARIVVDASGPAGVIASQVGLRKKKLSSPSPGMEMICECVSLSDEHKRTLAVYFGSNCAPHGYAWVFPMGGTQLKIGVCVYQPDKQKLPDLGALLREFKKNLSWLPSHETMETHGGFLYATGGIKNHVQGNILVIGDAADQVHPLYGEGIRHVLQSAQFARGVIVQSVRQNDLTKLLTYNKLWKSYVGWKWRMSGHLSRLLYPRLSDRGNDRITKLISTLSPQEIFDVAFGYRVSPILRSICRSVIPTRLRASSHSVH